MNKLFALTGWFVTLALAACMLMAAGQPKAPDAPRNAPPLFYLVTYTPGEKWVKQTHLLQQPGVMEHAAYWNDRNKTGELVMAGMLDDGLGGQVSLIQAKDLAAAQSLVDDDPAVKAKLVKAEVRSWRAISWMGETNLPAAAEKFARQQAAGK